MRMKVSGWTSIPKIPKIASLQYLKNISKKKSEMKLIFCMQTNVEVFYMLISVWNIFTISRKRRRGWSSFFCILIKVKVSTSWYYRF